LKAIRFGHEEIKRLVAFEEQIVQAVCKEKLLVTLFDPDEQLTAKVEAEAAEKLDEAIKVEEKLAREESVDNVTEEIKAVYEDEEEEIYKQVGAILDQMVKDGVRRLITKDKVRHDGRKIDEIRQL